MKEIHVSLTGHRPPKLYGYNLNHPKYVELQQKLEDLIYEAMKTNDIVWCHSGLALGADTVWSKAILNMRNKYPDVVKFYAEIPMPTQSERWLTAKDKEYWQTQVDAADDSSDYCPDFKKQITDNPEKEKQIAWKALNDRNRGMMEHADVVIAVYDGTKGGTANAVELAKKLNKPIIYVQP